MPNQDTQAVWEGLSYQQKKAGFYLQNISRLIKKCVGDRILEVGIGTGNITDTIIDQTTDYIGIDNVPEHIEITKSRFSNHAYIGISLDITKKESFTLLSQYDYNTIISFNCLEHVEDDAYVLEQLHAISKPNTRICLALPAHPFLFSYMDTQAGHHRRYSKKCLIDKLTQAGWVVEGTSFFNSIGVLPWYFIGNLPARNQQANPDELTTRWRFMYAALSILRFPLQVIFKIERLLKLPFGLTIIAWGKKQ